MTATAEPAAPTTDEPERDVWAGTPDPVLSPVAAKSHKYRITTERVVVEQGLMGKKADSLDLFRVKDLQVKKSMTQRARGRGDLTITSTDATTPHLKLESIQGPDDVAEQLRGLVRESRKRHGVIVREGM